MKPRKQFEPISKEDCVTPLDTEHDMFVPEMSMPVEQILSQFAFVDGVRLKDLMKQGYSSPDDDSAFDLPDFDSLDIAEKEEVYQQSVEFINKFESEQRKKKEDAQRKKKEDAQPSPADSSAG